LSPHHPPSTSILFAPFSRSDKLDCIADWTHNSPGFVAFVASHDAIFDFAGLEDPAGSIASRSTLMDRILLALVGRCRRAQEQPRRHHPCAVLRHTTTRDAARLAKFDPVGEEVTAPWWTATDAAPWQSLP
jgi:hypothetical protein